ncbi:coiled-coil domain-containing protein [Listeria seeligeri]|uniref:hypothetical protein n=1 Tax=Listeria seeligeri TaxID=1640 RepID=UPI0016249870|nr:hypothetical protein [Listeria seeligeri]MBC1578724.1 hypothetical protein [Listeria seeligeri]MBC1581208.1 hypothetical protein [Listeria seeligeri]MBC1593628.1 hypothetical protein [Listeria seeligeri]MBC2219307.1 hypothetical protein [Listeria seeligeri]MBC2247989.1 hypothetical protein [Listeria seeligeri]
MEQKELLNWYLNQQNDQSLTALLKIKKLRINGFDKITNSTSKEFVIRKLLMSKTINTLIDVLEKVCKDGDKRNQFNLELQKATTVSEIQEIMGEKLVSLEEIFNYSMKIEGYQFTEEVFLVFSSLQEMNEYIITDEKESRAVNEQKKEVEKLNARIAKLESAENREIKNYKKILQKKEVELKNNEVKHKKQVDMYTKELSEQKKIEQDIDNEVKRLETENSTQFKIIEGLKSELQQINYHMTEREEAFTGRIKELENKIKSLRVKKILIVGDPKNQEINSIDGIKVEIIEVKDTEDLNARLKDIIYEEMWVIEYKLSSGVKNRLKTMESTKPTKWFKDFSLLKKEMGVYK